MAVDVYFREDVQGAILAGLILSIQTNGTNMEFMCGLLAMAQHQALSFGISWPGIVDQVRDNLGNDIGALLEKSALLIKATT